MPKPTNIHSEVVEKYGAVHKPKSHCCREDLEVHETGRGELVFCCAYCGKVHSAIVNESTVVHVEQPIHNMKQGFRKRFYNEFGNYGLYSDRGYMSNNDVMNKVLDWFDKERKDLCESMFEAIWPEENVRGDEQGKRILAARKFIDSL